MGRAPRQYPPKRWPGARHQVRAKEALRDYYYFGRGQRILDVRREIKRKTIERRRRDHINLAA